MGNTTSDQRAPYVERFSLALLLPRFLLIGQVALMGGFGVAIMGVLGLMRYAGLPSNPFAVYADVMPGQPLSGLDTHGFTCSIRDYNYYHDPAETHCILTPDTGAFSRIGVMYSGGLIHEINFDIHDDAINVGDLAVLLGVAEIRPRGSVFFTWQGNVGVARIVKTTGRFSVLRHIGQLTLTDTRLSKQ